MENSVVSPLTGSKNIAVVETFSVDQIVREWQDLLRIDISSEFEGKDISKFDLYRCNDTNLLFFHPQLEGSPFIYQGLQDGFEWYYVEDKWEYEIALKEIRNSKSCLEIGSGSGAFVKKALGINTKIVGLETSSDAVEKARQANLPVYLMSFDEGVAMLGAQPDVVLAFQVLEHIANPLHFVKEMVRVLAVGGKLIICVPNADSFYKYGGNVLDMPPHHQTRWSLETFKKFEALFPLKLTKVAYEPLNHWHTESWLNENMKFYRNNKWYGNLLFNRVSVRVLRKILNSRMRSIFRGHTIYVSFEKTQ
ncbi:methyltransferase domain-containing protein [Hymenobacter sp. BT664]|uniref:Methyltransferase domain-containing protein n=1 Tax=Hymenobacter montanus TaxID=2771359 RepID=A0A927GHI0_9BACT|nr:class I SAM-dependent methyltransferase [Hymenobacter montanus]MBD2766433.1 methyltransferase domain-containing protein [Hymenobacter montanus]